jgi:outer membrane receptor for ferric coprogen and ferric-rhodotorulic acid
MWEYTFYQTAPMGIEVNGIADLWEVADDEGKTAFMTLKAYFEQGYEVQWTQLVVANREHAHQRMVFMLRRPKP